MKKQITILGLIMLLCIALNTFAQPIIAQTDLSFVNHNQSLIANSMISAIPYSSENNGQSAIKSLSTDDCNLTVTAVADPSIINKGASTIIKAYATPATVTYNWNTNETTDQISVSPTTTTTYTVTASQTSGNCTASAQTIIKVNPSSNCSMTVTASADQTIVNQGAQVTLTATAKDIPTGKSATYSWATNPPQFGASITVNPSTTTVYVVLASAVGTDGSSTCTATGMVTVAVTGIDDIKQNVNNISVYPIPSNNQINISFTSTEAQKINIKLINALGKVAYSKSINIYSGEYNKIIDVRTYAAGLYQLQIETPKGTKTKEVIIN
ncbi:MAG: T9SS type A sorting domain-containing protein [Bacteroidota bacterium]|nr:T9SS type A sorting domain-containing protein [Bacteroidota bacterium]